MEGNGLSIYDIDNPGNPKKLDHVGGMGNVQRVIEHPDGRDYETFMHRTLLEPLGTTSSSHVWHASFSETAAAGHDNVEKAEAGRTR